MIKQSFLVRWGMVLFVFLSFHGGRGGMAFELGVKGSSFNGIPFLKYTIQSHSEVARKLIDTGQLQMPISQFAILNRLDFPQSTEGNFLSFTSLGMEALPNGKKIVKFLVTTEKLSDNQVRALTLDRDGVPGRGPYVKSLGEFTLAVESDQGGVLKGAYLVTDQGLVEGFRFAYKKGAIQSISLGLKIQFVEALGHFQGDHPAVVTRFEKTGFSEILGLVSWIINTSGSTMAYDSEENRLSAAAGPVLERVNKELTESGLQRISF